MIRARARAALTALLVLSAVALSACSSDDEGGAGPAATQVPADGASPAPKASGGTPFAPRADPSAKTGPLSPTELPASSDLELATALDTNAPVDTASLGGEVTPTQVQAIRRAWNERQVAVDAAESGWCRSPGDGIWMAATPVEGGAPVVTFGLVGSASSLTCSLEDAVLVVDSASRQVLGDDTIAQFL